MAVVSFCLKSCMFVFNFVFLVCGCIILGVTIWMRERKFAPDLFEIPERFQIDESGYLLITVGSIIMVLGFLGCCGAMKDSQCMLLLFFIGLLLIFLLLVAAGVQGVKYKSEVKRDRNSSIEQLVDLLKRNATFQFQMREFEKENKCCGIKGEKDWENTLIKDGCACLTADVGTSVCSNTTNKYIKPCSAAITDTFKNLVNIVTWIAFGVASIVVLGLVFSICLYCQIQRK